MPEEDLAGLASLGDPLRRALYRYVASRGVPVGREEAAEAAEIGRSLAAYHLDRLIEEGLLDVSFERLGGRTGPGAGRPAKLYARSARQLELSLPPRAYELAARLLARAVEADRSGAARDRLGDEARQLGRELAAEVIRRRAPGADDRTALRQVLAERGYEPVEDELGALRLRNCPFDHLAAAHRELVCGMNLSLLDGVAEGLPEAAVRPGLDPRPGWCCVAFTVGDRRRPSRRRGASG